MGVCVSERSRVCACVHVRERESRVCVCMEKHLEVSLTARGAQHDRRPQQRQSSRHRVRLEWPQAPSEPTSPG